MPSSKKLVRLGLVGLGFGANYADHIRTGKVRRMQVTAVAARDRAKWARVPEAQGFPSAGALLASGLVDAVLVATPHTSHAAIGIAALQAGRHVLVEKPLAVHKSEAQRLIAAHQDQRLVFAAMFNQRTDPFYQKIRELVRRGTLGAIRRVSWTITDMFRPEAYYRAVSWRASWAGEGGGLLLNQCPHNLDLLQWMVGMPVRVRAFCNFGRYHAIEAEDDVTAYMEFPTGATGVLTTSTGEAPGTNRLEIAAENGRLVYEDDRLTFRRNAVPAAEFSRTATEPFAKLANTEEIFPITGHGGQQVEVLQNFADAILDGAPLIAPAAEGLGSLELANAMLLSTWTNSTIKLPLNGRRYAKALKEKIAATAGQ